MKVMGYMQRYGYEQVVFCHDPGAGLRAIIAIHDTTLGPALGGCRLWPYASEEEALLDVLRLARAMTYKNAAAGLNLGGGKMAVIAAPGLDRRELLFRAVGRFVASLGGRYITTEDVGTAVADMEVVRTQTRHVTGLPTARGGSGDPSPVTALGVYKAIQACAEEAFGSPSLKGKRVAVQGVGKVGYPLARHLHEEGAELVVADLNEASAERARKDFGASVVPPDQVFDVDCDILSPCALGAVLNDDTIPRLQCRIVCGAANNQLAEERHGDDLTRRGILYGPDFIANAGGVINISFELTGYDREAALARTAGIYDTMKQVIARSRGEGISTARAASLLAEERIEAVCRVKGLYLGKG